jgi:L-aspartate oxidase
MTPHYLFSLELDRLPTLESDFLIVGSGIAGLFAAYKAGKLGSVLVVTKQRAEDSNTEMAQGGIAAAVDETDSPVLHLEDTLEAGAGLCDAGAVEIMVTEGPLRVMELVELGVRFDREGSAWDLGREGAHRRRRILHASDATGGEVARALIRECRSDRNITLREGCYLVDFLRHPHSGRCVGALMLDSKSGGFVVCRAPVVIAATGGAGQLYRNTTNPSVATGDGAAAAYRAGAELMDMEFVQFHPTALAMPNAPHFLISEAVRGEGALLRNVRGERFMPRYHQMAELAPRDVVTRAIIREMQETQVSHVLLDISQFEPDRFQARFPNISSTCRKYGLDLDKGYIPVAPATHYIMGGIRTGSDGETNTPGLYACGEVACSGVHGANRLASNSLLEGLVFGARAVAAGWRYLQNEGARAVSSGPGTAALAGARQGGREGIGGADVQACFPVRRFLPGRAVSPDTAAPGAVTGSSEPANANNNLTSHLSPLTSIDGRQDWTSLTADLYDWRETAERVRAIMWNKVGIIRQGRDLAQAAVELNRIDREIASLTPTRSAVETVNLLTLGRLAVAAAQMRTESRGGHFRGDFPSRDDVYWLRHIIFQS